MSLQTTSSQTVGPYLHIGMTWLVTDNLVGPGVSGEQVTIQGRIQDGEGKPVTDALVEIWQANAHGKYAHPDDPQDKPLEPGFKGFGRVTTDEEGRFKFTTVKPGRVAAPGGGLQAPHINVTLLMRGMLKQLHSRIYFPGDPANAEDGVLQRVPQARRSTLIAKAIDGGASALEWDVILQGDGETAFFDC